MAKVLILGAGGMLGRALAAALPDAETRTHAECDVTDEDVVSVTFAATQPKIVVNCAGALPGASPEVMLPVNAGAPHVVARAAKRWGAQVVHVSTDCVFSGRQTPIIDRGVAPDARDIYGLTKAIGEVEDNHVLNVRTSFVGRDHGLIAWYRAQTQPVRGFVRWYWSGQTVEVVARAIAERVDRGRIGRGTVHLSTLEPVSKLDVLRMFHIATDGVDVIPDWRPYRNHALVPSQGWVLPPITMEDIERAM